MNASSEISKDTNTSKEHICISRSDTPIQDAYLYSNNNNHYNSFKKLRKSQKDDDCYKFNASIDRKDNNKFTLSVHHIQSSTECSDGRRCPINKRDNQVWEDSGALNLIAGPKESSVPASSGTVIVHHCPEKDQIFNEVYQESRNTEISSQEEPMTASKEVLNAMESDSIMQKKTGRKGVTLCGADLQNNQNMKPSLVNIKHRKSSDLDTKSHDSGIHDCSCDL